jgi:hypothetical protein
MSNKTRKKNGKTSKKTRRIKHLPNLTPKNINEMSELINQSVQINPKSLSYSPTVNKELVSLKSAKREKVYDCNNNKAFELEEPLQIGIPGNYYGKTCVPYYEPIAKKYLLKNLAANKHVDPKKIVPPVQSLSNCWFNTMFVTLFISDKGRKFFHFFRQLMIEGRQTNKTPIPTKLRNGFALLNYAIDACLTGNNYAYTLDTNAIIRLIYDAIPKEYTDKLPYLTDIEEAGNPLRYYGSLIYYLHNKSLQLTFISNAKSDWKNSILKEIDKEKHLPHLIILEIFDGKNGNAGNSGITTNKPKSFFIKGAKYDLDSCIIRDTSQKHFCALITCEKQEMGYDGLSYHRLTPFIWKKHINSDYIWEFDGTVNGDGTNLKWNFLHGYQMLIYYRVK